MIGRVHDATFLNYVANHPGVRPWMGKDASGSLTSATDLGPIIESGKAIALVEPGAGGFVIINEGNRIYEIHTMFLPEHRGPLAFRAAEECLEYMFTQTDCDVIFTQLPESNRPARLFALKGGFRIIADRPSAWRDLGGVGEDAAITKSMWLQRRANRSEPRMEAILEPPCQSSPQQRDFSEVQPEPPR